MAETPYVTMVLESTSHSLRLAHFYGLRSAYLPEGEGKHANAALHAHALSQPVLDSRVCGICTSEEAGQLSMVDACIQTL